MYGSPAVVVVPGGVGGRLSSPLSAAFPVLLRFALDAEGPGEGRDAIEDEEVEAVAKDGGAEVRIKEVVGGVV